MLFVLVMIGGLLTGDGTDASLTGPQVIGKYTSQLKCNQAKEVLEEGKLHNANYFCVKAVARK